MVKTENNQPYCIYPQKPYLLAYPSVVHAPELVRIANGFEGESKWQRFLTDGVATALFDLESTLVDKEAFPEWGKMVGANGDLTSVTNATQEGLLLFHLAVYLRLLIAQPNQEMIDRVDQLYVSHLVPGAKEVMRGLRIAQKKVRVVSMGFTNVMGSVQSMLGVRMHGGTLYLDGHGKYAGYSDDSMLGQDGGKRMFVDDLDAKGEIERPIAMVGDGMTDMAVNGLRIGFGGVEKRESVRRAADMYTCDLPSVLVLLIGENGWKKIAAYGDKAVVAALAEGMQSILNGSVEFKDKALEMALCDRIHRFLDPRIDRDTVVYQNTV